MVGNLCFAHERDCEVKRIQEFEQDTVSAVASNALSGTRNHSSLTLQPPSLFDIGIMGFGDFRPRYLPRETTKGFVPPEPHVLLPPSAPYLPLTLLAPNWDRFIEFN